MEENSCCKNCKFYKFESVDEGFVCANPDSEYFSDWTGATDLCEDHEEKED